jgi:hypothetical protein
MQFTQRPVSAAFGAVIARTGAGAQAKNFPTSSGDSAMQIKPPTASHTAPAPQAARTAAAAGKGGDFAQMLKTAQAEAPASSAAAPAKG